MFKNYFRPLACLGFFLSVLLMSQASWAQTWTGGAGDRNWNSANNWSPAVVPNLASTNVNLNFTTTAPYFITVNTTVNLSSLQISSSGVTLHLGNGGNLKLAGDLTINAGAFLSASHPSGKLELNGSAGFTPQSINANGGTIRVPNLTLNNTGSKLIKLINNTVISLDGYDAAFATVLNYQGVGNSLEVQTGSSVKVERVAGIKSAISLPNGSGVVTGNGTFGIDGNTVILPANNTSASFSIEPTLVLNYSISVPPTEPVFDIGFTTLKLGGDFTNNILAGGSSQTLGQYAQLEFGKISGNQTYTGPTIEVAKVYINKSADKVILNGDVALRFTTTPVTGTYNPATHGLVTFATGSTSELEIASGKSLRFATSGFISAGNNSNGTETMLGSKISGAGSIVIDNYPTSGTTPAITVTLNSDLLVGANVTVKNGHALDLKGSTLGLSANLVADGFVTSTVTDGTLRFTSTSNQTVSTTLAQTIKLPKVEMAKTGGGVTFNNHVDLIGASTGNILAFITFKENTQSRINIVSLNLAANQFLTISGVGALTVQGTPSPDSKIQGTTGSTVTFYTASTLGSDFTINTPNTLISNYDVNISQYKLTLGGNLGNTSNVTASNNAYITATNYASAQVIFSGANNTTSTIGAFITGLPNVKVNSGATVQLLGNVNFYGSPTVAPAAINTLQLDGVLDLSNRFATISGFNPIVGYPTAGRLVNNGTTPATAHAGVFISGNNNFLTINSSLASIDLGNKVDLVIGQGSGLNMGGRNLVIHGDLTNNSTSSSVFATTSNTSTERVEFADNTGGKGNFSTISGSVDFPRLAVTKTNSQTIATPTCFTSVSPNAGLNIGSAFVTVSANTGTVLDLRTTGVIVMNGGQITKINDGGDVVFGNAGSSFISGSGNMFFSGHTTVTAGDLVSYGPAIGVANGKTLTLATNAKLSVGGDLTGGNIAGTGAVRFIGGNFQTVNIAYLPGMIIDKCPTGPFLTVGQQASFTLGSAGLTIDNGVLAMNSVVFTSGNVLVKAGANNFITSNITIGAVNFTTTQAQLAFNTVAATTLEDQDGTIDLPSLALYQGGDVTTNSNVRLVGGNPTATAFYTALDMQSAGNFVLNGKTLTFRGGNNAAASQQGTGVVSGAGNVLITATNVYFSTVTSNKASFVISNADLTFVSGGRAALNAGTLSLGGNLVNNSQVDAFITTTSGNLGAAGGEAYGLLNMTGANVGINGTATGIQVPALKVDGKLNLGIGTAGTGYVNLTQYYGNTDATSAFMTTLAFAGANSSIELNNRFLTISGEGVINGQGGSITGGTTASGVTLTKNIEGARSNQFITGVLNIPTAGVVTSVANTDSRIIWDNRYIYDLSLGGNLTNLDANNSSLFWDLNGTSTFPATQSTAARNSVIRFKGATFTTIENINNVPNMQVEKSADLFVKGLAGNTMWLHSSGNQANNNKLAITGAGNLVFDANTDVRVYVENGVPNNATIAQTGTGIIKGDAGRTFLIDGAVASFVTVASNNFTVTGFNNFNVATTGSKIHLVGAYDAASTTATGATLTLGTNNFLNNTAQSNVFGYRNGLVEAYTGSADMTAGVANHQYTPAAYNNALLFMSATSNLHNQTIGGNVLSYIPRLRAQGLAGSFSTVTLTDFTGNALLINGQGVNTVLDLDRSVLRFPTTGNSSIKIFATNGSISATNGAFISGDGRNTDAAKYNNSVDFSGGTTVATNFLFDKTSVIVRTGQTITTNNLLQIGGSLAGNVQPLATALRENFTATATVGTGVAGTGTVEYVRDSNLTQEDLSGIGTLPRLSINTNSDVRTMTSPGQKTTLTQAGDALTFKSGRFILGIAPDANELDITGTAASVRNEVNAYHVMFNTVGSVKFSGAGENTIYHATTNGGAPSSSVVTVNATQFPKIDVTKANGQVKLNTNIYITASSAGNLPTLVLNQGDMDLNGQNILLAQGALLSENLGLDYNVYDSKATLGPDYNRAGGNIYATAVAVTNTPTSLAGTGIVLANGAAGTFYSVDITRRHGVGNGSLDAVTAAINRYYNVTQKTTTLPVADATTQILYPNSELNGYNSADLSVLRFVTADPAGVYSSRSGSTAGANNVSVSNPTLDFSAGYLTLGANQINLFTTIPTGATVTDAREDNNTTFSSVTGGFRLVYPKATANVTVGLKVVVGTKSATVSSNLLADNEGTNGDYFVATATGTPLTVDANGNFNVILPANTFQQFITVYAKHDLLLEGDEFVTVQLVSNGTSGFSLGRFTTASLTIKDNDVPGFEVAFATAVKGNATVDGFATNDVTTNGTLQVTEFMSAESFGVRLNFKPTANVTIEAVSNNTAEGTVNPASVTFTPTNWMNFQTVTLTGVDDPIFDGDKNFFVTVRVATGSAPEYLNPSLVSSALQTSMKSVIVKANNKDNEEAIKFVTSYSAGFTVNETSPNGQTALAGGASTQTIFVSVNAQPNANQVITVDLATSNPRLTLTPNVVTFTNANWNVAQQINVNAANEAIDNDDVVVNVIPSFTTTNGVIVDRATLSIPTYTVKDDDTAGLEFTTTDGGEVNEAGTKTVTFQVRLRTQPFATVNVNATSLDAAEATTSPSVAVFTADNWNTYQTITIKGVEDGKKDGDKLFQVEIGNTASDDAKYNNVANFDWTGSQVKPLASDTKYQFLFKNVDSGKETNTGGTTVTPPSTPSGLVATAGSGKVTLTWAPNSPSDGNVTYEIYYYAVGKPEVKAGETNSTTFTVTGLENGVTYAFRIRAKKVGATESGFTASISARPSIILGTELDKVANAMSVYPNPSNGTFTIKLEGVNATRMNISVADITGKVIFTQEFSNVNGSFQKDLVMKDMPAGLYILTVATDNDTYQAKLMLENR